MAVALNGELKKYQKCSHVPVVFRVMMPDGSSHLVPGLTVGIYGDVDSWLKTTQGRCAVGCLVDHYCNISSISRRSGVAEGKLLEETLKGSGAGGVPLVGFVPMDPVAMLKGKIKITNQGVSDDLLRAARAYTRWRVFFKDESGMFEEDPVYLLHGALMDRRPGVVFSPINREFVTPTSYEEMGAMLGYLLTVRWGSGAPVVVVRNEAEFHYGCEKLNVEYSDLTGEVREALGKVLGADVISRLSVNAYGWGLWNGKHMPSWLDREEVEKMSDKVKRVAVEGTKRALAEVISEMLEEAEVEAEDVVKAIEVKNDTMLNDPVPCISNLSRRVIESAINSKVERKIKDRSRRPRP